MARKKVLKSREVQECRMEAIVILATHWRSQRKACKKRQREQAVENTPAKSSKSHYHIVYSDTQVAWSPMHPRGVCLNLCFMLLLWART